MLILIVLIVAVALVTLLYLYKVFAMSPLYVSQRSIYEVYKQNPYMVVSSMTSTLQYLIGNILRSYDEFSIQYGAALNQPILTGGSGAIVPSSYKEALLAQYKYYLSQYYTPLGMDPNPTWGRLDFNITNVYGALSMFNTIIALNNASIYGIAENETSFPLIGLNNVKVKTTMNFTVNEVQPSSYTCPGTPSYYVIQAVNRTIFNFEKSPNTKWWALASDNYGEISHNSSGWWLGSNGLSGLMYLMPLDNISSNYGFNISAIMTINKGGVGGIEIFQEYPVVGTQQCNSNYDGGAGYCFNYMYTTSSNNPLTVNMTVDVSFGKQPTVTFIVINTINKQVLYKYNSRIAVPAWVKISSLFGVGYEYGAEQGVGSWALVVGSNAVVSEVSVKLINRYYYPKWVLLQESWDGAPPALGGVILSLDSFNPSKQETSQPLEGNSLVVCNVTSTSLIFNVSLPYPSGYPVTQYIINSTLNGLSLFTSPMPASAYAMVPYMNVFSNNGALFYYVYVGNWGGTIPTILLFYNGLDSTLYDGYATISQVASINTPSKIFPTVASKTEMVYIPVGYTMLKYVTIIPSYIANKQLIGTQVFYYEPSSTHESLPFTVANQTYTVYDNYYNYFIPLTMENVNVWIWCYSANANGYYDYSESSYCSGGGQ